MTQTLLRARLVKVHNGKFAVYGGDSRYTEFCRFLYNEVHPLAARDTLNQAQIEWRFDIAMHRVADKQFDFLLADEADS
jgi:hypothetical protein